jgi:hypothetical protein
MLVSWKELVFLPQGDERFQCWCIAGLSVLADDICSNILVGDLALLKTREKQ